MSNTPEYDLKNGKPHPYHIVRPSIWPFASSCVAGLMATGAVMWFHEAHMGLLTFLLGLLGVLSVMWLWWRDVISEAVAEKAHSPRVKTGLRYGMLLFICSEIMFFVAFFWAFFNASLFPTEAIGFQWPPADIETIDAFHLPLLMTMVLLLSGCTVTWAHHAILENKQSEAVTALAITVALGILFTCLQGYEYFHASFPFEGNVYSSAFYMATGFHGFHVIVGTIFLLVCYSRAKKGHFKPKDHFGFEAAAWYWHFVDVVWLFLFVSIYWWGNA